MSPPSITHRVFVVGVPRSGTTLVQGLLAAHSEACSFTESHFFSRYFRAVRILGTSFLVKSPMSRVGEFFAENEVQAAAVLPRVEALDRLTRVAPLRLPFRSKAVAREFLMSLDAISSARGFRYVIEKTPRHLHHLAFIERVLGRLEPTSTDLSFVHVVRRGIPTVASLFKASLSWDRPYNLKECVARWNRDVALSLARPQTERDLFVSYEALSLEPERVLNSLLSQLGWSAEENLIARFKQGVQPLVTEGEAWKQQTARTIRPSDSSAEVLTEKERHWAEEHLRHDLYEAVLRRCAVRPQGAVEA